MQRTTLALDALCWRAHRLWLWCTMFKSMSFWQRMDSADLWSPRPSSESSKRRARKSWGEAAEAPAEEPCAQRAAEVLSRPGLSRGAKRACREGRRLGERFSIERSVVMRPTEQAVSVENLPRSSTGWMGRLNRTVDLGEIRDAFDENSPDLIRALKGFVLAPFR